MLNGARSAGESSAEKGTAGRQKGARECEGGMLEEATELEGAMLEGDETGGSMLEGAKIDLAWMDLA